MKASDISVINYTKECLAIPPACMQNGFLSDLLNRTPDPIRTLTELVFNVTASQFFDNNSSIDHTLYAFIHKQYALMNDILILHDKYDRTNESNWYNMNISSIWSLGSIAASMAENLLLFGWIADDFINRSNLFHNYYAIQDLIYYPTKVIVENINIDESILGLCKKHHKDYQTKKAKFICDADYTNKDNYVKEWYQSKMGGLRDVSENIGVELVFGGQKIDWKKQYSSYKYLCDFKHIGQQRSMVHSSFNGIKDSNNSVMSYSFRAFILVNMLLIYIYEKHSMTMDSYLLHIKKITEELNINLCKND